MVTNGVRRHVVAWWLFYKQDGIPPGVLTPEMIVDMLTEAEGDLKGCNEILQSQYSEYIPQRILEKKHEVC